MPRAPYAEAEDSSEFIENLADNGHNHRLVIIAPHGGNIEKYTDEQAEHIGRKLSSEYVSEWICNGFHSERRWCICITSTDICEESFPKLNTIIRRNFEYSVAFHGWDNDSVCIGGTIPKDARLQIKIAIEKTVRGHGIIVIDSNDESGVLCLEEFNGNDPKNIVNHLSTKGLQIEQSIHTRKCYGLDLTQPMSCLCRNVNCYYGVQITCI